MFKYNPKQNLVGKPVEQGGITADFVSIFKERLSIAEKANREFAPFRNELACHFLPEAKDYTYKGAGGTEKSASMVNKGRLYDDTGATYSRHLASEITNKLIDDRLGWLSFKLQPSIKKNSEKADIVEAEKMLFEYTQTFMNFIRRSNLRNVMHQATREWVVFDTCAIYCRERRGNLRTSQHKLEFSLMPAGSYYVEPAPSSDRTGIFWKREWTKKNFIREMPEVAAMDEDLYNGIIKEGEVMSIVTACLPVGTGSEVSVIIYREDNQKVLWVQQTQTSPIIYGARGLQAGKTYPMGWGSTQLPTVHEINTVKYSFLQGLAYQINPMYIASSSFENKNFKPGPGRIVRVGGALENGQSREIAPLPQSGDPMLALKVIQEAKESMRKGMGLANEFNEGAAGRSATEIRAAMEQERRRTGPVIDDFRLEILEPLIFWAAKASKNLDILPKELTLDGKDYGLRVVGDNDDYDKTIRRLNLRELVETVAFIPPDIQRTMFDYEGIMRDNAVALDQYDALKSPEEILQMQEEEAELKAQALQQQAQAQGQPA